MKVYVAITGIYENTWPSGVYASPELAMAAHHRPGMKWTKSTTAGASGVPEKYRHLYGEPTTTWENNKDWDEACSIHEFELVTEGETRAPDRVQQEVYRDSDGGWDYVDPEADDAARETG